MVKIWPQNYCCTLWGAFYKIYPLKILPLTVPPGLNKYGVACKCIQQVGVL